MDEMTGTTMCILVFVILQCKKKINKLNDVLGAKISSWQSGISSWQTTISSWLAGDSSWLAGSLPCRWNLLPTGWNLFLAD